VYRLALSACGLLFAAVLLAAPGKERPALRVDNYSVLVDVIVTDKHNRHVTDLRAEDFLIFEDGEPQELGTFQVISGRSEPARATQTAIRSDKGMPAESAEQPRLIILLLDYATVEYLNQGYVREAAVRYIKEHMVPGDLIAVFQVGMSLKFLQQFTDNKEQIVKALQGSELAGSSYALDQEILSESAQTAQDRSQLFGSSIESIVTGSPGGAQGQQVAVVEILNQYMLMAQRLEARYYSQLSFSRQQQSRPIIGAIETIARGVEHIQGRKTLIMFSQGFSVPMSLERAFYRCVHVANRSNLAIYAVDAAGLQFKQPKTEQELYDVSAARPGDRKMAYAGISQFDRAREIGSDQKDSNLRYLTSATGGFLIRHTNDFLSALKRIDADARSHYLLSYRSRKIGFEGEFRTIRIELKRPELQVRARPGYWALPPGASVLSPEEYRRLIQVTSGAGGESESRTFSLSSHCSHFLDANGRYSVYLLADLPLKELVVHHSDDRAFIELEAIGIVRDEHGEVVTSFRGPSRISTTSARAAEVQTARFGTTLVLPPGKYSITLLVTDPASQKTAREERSLLLVPPTDSLAVSSVCLSREATRVSSSATGPFTVAGSEIIVSSDRLFGPSDPLICFFRIYRPGLTAQQDANVECEVSLIFAGKTISRNGIPVEGRAVDLTPVPNLPVARYFSLEGLPPGPYIVRVEARDRIRGESASAQASFRLLRAGGKITD